MKRRFAVIAAAAAMLALSACTSSTPKPTPSTALLPAPGVAIRVARHQHGQLDTLQRRGEPDPQPAGAWLHLRLRLDQGAAGLATPEQRQDLQPGADPGAQRQPEQPDRLAARESGRPGRLRRRTRRRAHAGTAERDHRPVRPRRLRPARCRPLHRGAVHQRERPGRALRGDARPGLGRAVQLDRDRHETGRGAVRHEVRRATAAVLDRAGRPRHGRDPRPPSATRNSATSATRTARCSAPSTPSCSRRRSARWCSTARSTRCRTPSRGPKPRPAASSWRSATSSPGARPTRANARSGRTRAARSTVRSPPPARLRSPNADGRKVTDGWVYYGIISAMYSQQLWPVLGQAIAQLSQQQPAPDHGAGRPVRRARRERQLLQPARREPRRELRRLRQRTDRRPGAATAVAVAQEVSDVRCVGRGRAAQLRRRRMAGQGRPVPDREGRGRPADPRHRYDERSGHALRRHREARQHARRRARC